MVEKRNVRWYMFNLFPHNSYEKFQQWTPKNHDNFVKQLTLKEGSPGYVPDDEIQKLIETTRSNVQKDRKAPITIGR
jgi:hypothetical protein